MHSEISTMPFRREDHFFSQTEPAAALPCAAAVATATGMTPDIPANDAMVRSSVIVGTSDGKDVQLDIEKMLKTRMLIQAASGGGKSWVLRRVLENSFDQVQQIILDPESELVTLAEKFDYLVCSADSAEFPINGCSGARTARTIFTSGRSAIISLAELDMEEMHDFAEGFFKELLRIPQEDWHHLVIAVDEAQLFAPQHDKATSKKPFVDLARRARKRGIGLICACQRISEISKGVTAQLENKLIGLTTEIIDLKRAAQMLGVHPVEAKQTLGTLDAGTFVAIGPALGHTQRLVRVGPIVSRHGFLNTFTGRRPSPSLTLEEVSKALKESFAPKPEEALEDEEEPAPNKRHSEEFKLYAVAPLLGDHLARGAMAARALEIGVPYQTMYAWVQARRSKLEDARPVPNMGDVIPITRLA
jgi:hypothetical protein